MSEPATTGADRRPLLVLVSSLTRSTREFFFRAVTPYYRVWLLLGGAGRSAEATWQVPYLVGWTTVDTLDPDAMAAVVRELMAKETVAGIHCFDEARIEATAKTATMLGLPTTPPEAILRCRDKVRSRQAFAQAGIPQPRSAAVHSLDEAAEVARAWGYPVVLKPRNLAASFGIRRADSADELAEAYRVARETTLPEAPERYADGVLVEEYVDGPEISIDAACFDGRVVPLVVARKETGFPPYFEELGHVVDGNDPLREDRALADLLTRTHAAVGFTTGVTHTEFRLSPSGPKVVELNGRSGGDLIPYLGQLATGVDVSLVAVAIACGQAPDIRQDRSRVAAIRFYYPEHRLTLHEARFEPALLPAEIESAGPMAEPGTVLEPPPGGFSFTARLAYAVAVADGAAACRSALDAAGKALTVDAEDV
jgi:biotin carboxylase